MHDLFISSVICLFLQCALLPSTHSLRMLGSVSPFLRRPCPFCTQDLVPVLTLFWQHRLQRAPCQFFTQLSLVSLTPSSNFPLCCADICGPPDFDPLNDRQMEWSPVTLLPKVPLIGFFNGSVAPAGRPRPVSSVFLLCCNRVWQARCAFLCQLVVPHDGVSHPQSPVPPAPACSSTRQ